VGLGGELATGVVGKRRDDPIGRGLDRALDSGLMRTSAVAASRQRRVSETAKLWASTTRLSPATRASGDTDLGALKFRPAFDAALLAAL
jgi:hypothetical protein